MGGRVPAHPAISSEGLILPNAGAADQEVVAITTLQYLKPKFQQKESCAKPAYDHFCATASWSHDASNYAQCLPQLESRSTTGACQQHFGQHCQPERIRNALQAVARLCCCLGRRAGQTSTSMTSMRLEQAASVM